MSKKSNLNCDSHWVQTLVHSAGYLDLFELYGKKTYSDKSDPELLIWIFLFSFVWEERVTIQFTGDDWMKIIVFSTIILEYNIKMCEVRSLETIPF